MRLAWAIAAAVAFVVLCGSPAHADPSGSLEDDSAVLEDEEYSQDESPAYPAEPASNGAPVEPQPYYEYKYEAVDPETHGTSPYNGGNSYTVFDCPKGEVYTNVYRRLVDPTVSPARVGDWQIISSDCRGKDEPMGVVEPEVTTELVVDAALEEAPSSDVNVQPNNRTLVNVANNYYAEDESVTKPVYVLGQRIRVTFEPASFTWDFGDGGVGHGKGIEDAEFGQPGAVEYAYDASGSYDITLERTFTVSFTLPNGESHDIDGVVTSESKPFTLEVGESQAVVTDID